MPWLSPYLTVKDSAAALDFYQRAFGFEKKFAVEMPDGRIGHCEMVWNDSLIMFGPEMSNGGPCKAPVTLGVQSPVSLYVYCDDVDGLSARAQKAGAKLEMAPQDMFYGDRVCKLIDPDGHSWYFATHTGRKAPPPWEAGAKSAS
jgi:PhnB protein